MAFSIDSIPSSPRDAIEALEARSPVDVAQWPGQGHGHLFEASNSRRSWHGPELPNPASLAHIDSYDNALTETIKGLYKAELIRRRAPWKTRDAVDFATLEWVSWFNHQYLLEPIGYIPPAEAEANHYRQLASQTNAVAS